MKLHQRIIQMQPQWLITEIATIYKWTVMHVSGILPILLFTALLRCNWHTIKCTYSRVQFDNWHVFKAITTISIMDIPITLCNLSLLLPHPQPQSPGNYWSAFGRYESLLFSGILCKWHHTVCSLFLCMASFTQHKYFEVYSCDYIYQYFTLFYC